MKRSMRLVALMGATSALALMCSSPAEATVFNGTIYFTTFAGGTNLDKADYSYDDSVPALTLGSPVGLSNLSGADGILFAPSGNLLVGGQAANIIEASPAGGAQINNVNPGSQSFHLALSSNSPSAIVYNICNGGCGDNPISAVTLVGGHLSGAGVAYSVHDASGAQVDVRGMILDPVSGIWYYGTAGDGSAAGDFGFLTINDVTHTAIATPLLNNQPAHGLTYDPFTGDIIYSSDTKVVQYKPGTGIVSTFTSSDANDQFDQSATDGKGHLFVASNDGSVLFIDYSSSLLIGDAGNYSTDPFLADSLDDIAPLSGTGSHQAPEPATLAILGIGLAGLGVMRRRRAA